MKNLCIKHFLAAAAVMLFPLAAICGAVERDELFFSALEHNGVKRALLLIKAAEAAPESAESPLAMLQKTRLSRQEMAECIKKYDLLWQKFPDHPEIVWNGMLLYEKFTGLNRNVLANLKKSRSIYSACGSQHPLINEIIRFRISLHTLLGDSKDGIVFASKLSSADCFTELATLYHTAAYRAKVNGDATTAEKLHKKYLDAVNSNIKNIPETMSVSNLAALMVRLFDRKEHEHADAVFSLLKKKTGNQELLDNIRTLFCMKSSNFDAARREADLIKNASVNKNVLLFNAAINAHRWETAKKLLTDTPAENRAREATVLAIAVNDAQTIVRAGNDPAFSKQERMLFKFHAASLLNDKKLYFEAKKLAGNTPLSIDALNTIGYTAAELGIELKEAESLLCRALKSAPCNAAYLDSLAFICYRMRRYAEAEKLINRALECITPDTPPSVILEHAGDIAAAQGNFHRAKELYLRALDMGRSDTSFNFKSVKNKLDRLK